MSYRFDVARNIPLLLLLLPLVASCVQQPEETNAEMIARISAPTAEQNADVDEFKTRTTSQNVPKKLAKMAEDAVGASLKDADSAKYKIMFMSTGPTSTAVCGIYNAKNSFGAYVGFKAFYVEFADGKPIPDDLTPGPGTRFVAVCDLITDPNWNGFNPIDQ